MMIDFLDETERVSQESIKRVMNLIEFAAKRLELPENSECSITLVTNDAIQEINRNYRGKDQPTDVISFALNDEGDDDDPFLTQFAEMEGDFPNNLGDIIISTEKTEEQAVEYGHSFERELGFLALHGFLHLNGYDHMSEEEEAEMFGLQKEILDAYGLKREE